MSALVPYLRNSPVVVEDTQRKARQANGSYERGSAMAVQTYIGKRFGLRPDKVGDGHVRL